MASNEGENEPRKVAPAQPSPRLLNQAIAAAYLSISERMFEKQWRAERLPQPLRFGRRLVWDRKMLDLWADEASGIAPVDPFADL